MVLGSNAGDSIVIAYSAENDCFDVTYFDASISRHIKYKATPDQIDSLVDALILRLLFRMVNGSTTMCGRTLPQSLLVTRPVSAVTEARLFPL